MSQISPPIRILALAVLGLLAAWMLFLRPQAQPAVAPPTTPAVEAGGAPAQTAAGAAVEAANDAAAPSAAAVEATPATTPAAPTAATAAPKAERAQTGGLPKPVGTALARDKVLVLLFWSRRAADDRAVRAELRRVDRHKGGVVVHAAPMKRFARFQSVTRGAKVEQSPTVVVVDRDRKAETLVGYVDRVSIDQAVTDALRNS